MKHPTKTDPVVFLLLIVALGAGLLAGCGGSGGSGANNASPATAGAGPAALQRDVFDRYSAEFQIQFQGSSPWLYQLKTRRAPEQREVSLHLEGLEPAKNPGDIRLLTDGAQSWMIGAGTDGECVQFPNGQGMDPTFLFPESLVDVTGLGSTVKLVGEEQSNAIPEAGTVTLQHYHVQGIITGVWQKTKIDYWVDKASGMLYRFSMQAEGEDPFFSTGRGQMAAQYQVGGLGEQPFEPVAGCELDVPLPENASGYVRLPGMAAFDSPDGVETVQQYYQGVLTQQNWAETQPPAQQNGATVLSYGRDGQSVQIVIEPAAAGSKVKILILQ